jgi:hypothetical protein
MYLNSENTLHTINVAATTGDSFKPEPKKKKRGSQAINKPEATTRNGRNTQKTKKDQ